MNKLLSTLTGRRRNIPPRNPKGLVLKDEKSILDDKPIAINTLPESPYYIFDLRARNGDMAIATVQPGDRVFAGDIIAKPISDTGLYIHAPTSGWVIDSQALDDKNNEADQAVEITSGHAESIQPEATNLWANLWTNLSTSLTIQADGKDEAAPFLDSLAPYWEQSVATLLDRIRSCGVAGMGGAGFATEKKISMAMPSTHVTVETLIINGAESDPHLQSDDALMQTQATAILIGAQMIAYIVKAKSIIIGVNHCKKNALAAMQNALASLLNSPQSGQPVIPITLEPLPDIYPIGSRYQIAEYLLGKKTPIGERTHRYGFLCHNVATAAAVYEAINLGKPLTERLVTVAGDAVNNPAIYRCKIGTPISHLASIADFSPETEVVISGGLMMGTPIKIASSDSILKQTTGVFAFHHAKPQQPQSQNCIRCGHCADVCPVNLLPQQLQHLGQHALEKAVAYRLTDCIECGLCSYVCPSEIPLVEIIQAAKKSHQASTHEKILAQHAKKRYENREIRLKQLARAQEIKIQEHAKKLEAPDIAPDIAAKITAQSSNKAASPDRPLSEYQTNSNQRDNTSSDAVDIQQSIAPATANQLIADALARTQAKKNQTANKQSKLVTTPKATEKTPQQNESAPMTNNDTTTDNPYSALIQAAITRSTAKKASVVKPSNKNTNTNPSTNHNTTSTNDDE